MKSVQLNGLDGANPLAFLAALGVLIALTDQGEEVTLHWADDGVWRPVITGAGELDRVIEILDTDRISCQNEPALELAYDAKRDLKPPPAVFRAFLTELVGRCQPSQRRSVDWALAFGSDVIKDNSGNTKPTALHFTAGQQQFLEMVQGLLAGIGTTDLREALSGPWLRAASLPVLGWDATTSRDYALRARNPSSERKLGVPGADWLGLRGLALLPAVPVGRRLETTGCGGTWKAGWFQWPLWVTPVPRSVVASLLRLSFDDLAAAERTALGVAAVLRSGIRRSDQGGYGSFEPAAVA